MTKLIKLTFDCLALVDDEDYESLQGHNWKLWRRHKKKKLYAGAYTTVDGKRKAIAMHAFIMNAKKGDIIDHVDGDGLNNTRANLRFCNQSGNSANRLMSSNNTSGYKGVAFHKRRKSNQWEARTKLNKKQIHIGYFSNPEDAARAYDAKAIELFGEFAKTNESLGLLTTQCKKEG